MHIKVHFDGAVSKSQLGCDMGIGVAVFINNVFQEELSKFVGIKGSYSSSSNVAEWMGCIEAYKLVSDYKEDGDKILVYSDSQLITNQFNGEWNIKDEKFKEYYREAKMWYHKAGMDGTKIIWVRREFNKEADILSKKGLKQIVN